MTDWLPFGFALVLWLTLNPAMAMIWILAYGLGLVPVDGQDEAMIAISLLAIVREMIVKARMRDGI